MANKFMKRFTNAGMRVGANGAGQMVAGYAAKQLLKPKDDGTQLIKPKGLFALMTLASIAGVAYSKNQYVQDFAIGFGGSSLVREAAEFSEDLKTGLGLSGVEGVADTSAEDIAYWQDMYEQARQEANAASYAQSAADDQSGQPPRKTGKKGTDMAGL